MGKRGTPKMPSSLVVLNGNRSNRLNKREAKPAPAKKPQAPSWLNVDAKKMWKRLMPILEKDGLLTIVDLEAFAGACQSYGTYVECEKALKEKGRILITFNGYEQLRPEVTIGNAALKAFKGFCGEFGLTPSARAGIPLDERGGAEDIEALLAR